MKNTLWIFINLALFGILISGCATHSLYASSEQAFADLTQMRFVKPFEPDSEMERGVLQAQPAPNGKLQVSATRQWSETGLTLKKGQMVEIKASGTVMVDSTRSSDPKGIRWYGYPHNGDWIFSLIGKIKDKGRSAEFYVGDFQKFNVPFNGRLLLGMADSIHKDNSGAYTVAVSVDGKPVDFRKVAIPKAEVAVAPAAKTELVENAKPAPAPSATQEVVNYLGQANFPKVAQLDPPNGAADVDPSRKAIAVTFDRPMSGGYSWVDKGQRPPLGQITWVSDTQCQASVELEPDRDYAVWLNFGPRTSHFRSKEGVAADRVLWKFHTSKGITGN